MKKFSTLVCFILGLTACTRQETPEYTQKVYSAWKSANPDHKNLTFSEWSVLRETDLLPGVDYAKIYAARAKDSAEAAQISSSVALGVSVGSASSATSK